MQERRRIIGEKLIDSISEGVVVIGRDGVIRYANTEALKILGVAEEELVDKTFARFFFGDQENDEFNQIVLDSIYDPDTAHQAVVPYRNGEKTLHLRVVSSSFVEDDGNKNVIMVFSDLSEIMELRDSVRSMEKIRELNSQLEIRNRLISETFGRFLSDDIVRHILDSPDGLKLGGHKQEVTMMMSDLRGFTAMSEWMDAADLISMLNHYLGEMTEVIQSHRGTIIEFIGDGIMAVFGAPEVSDTHAMDAVAAALEMQTRMEAVNQWNAGRNYPELEMGIGLNTGEVIVGNLGSEKRTKYGVVGSHVNLCGRIESYSVGGQVLISSSTKAQITTGLEVVRAMTVYPKGANGEVEITQVSGIGEPYNIHVELQPGVMQQLEHPIPVRMHKLDGKHKNPRTIYGGITAVARDGAMIETDVSFALYDNLQIDAGGNLLCKVVEINDNICRIDYTSVPTGYPAWLKAYRNI